MLLFALGRIRRGWLIALLGVIVLIDLVPVNLRYLPQSRFVAARRQQIQPTEADRAILRDPEPGIPGAEPHGQPLQRCYDLLLPSLGGRLPRRQTGPLPGLDRALSHVDGRGRTRHAQHALPHPLRPDGQPVAELRATANGPAWFVQEVVDADTPQKEIDALGRIDTKTAAVINTREFDIRPLIGGEGEIRLEEYRPNYLRYEYTATAPGTAIFSEIYYKDGWTAYIDGIETPYFRADYLLRGMELPAGTHTVEWRFRAPGWNVAEGVTLASSLAILAGIIATVILVLRHERRQKTQA